jgi:N-acetylmuramoyl-L-alanine amidase
LGNEVGDIFISIHHNANTNRNVYGTESFYFLHIPDDDYDYNGHYGRNDINHGTANDINSHALTSRGLAEIMQRQLVNRIGFRDRGIHNRRFVVLRYSQIPATLVELGFMSNQQELDIMRTEAFQRQAAQAIYNGLLEVFAHYPPPR